MIYVIESIIFIAMTYIFNNIRNMKFYTWVLEHNKYTEYSNAIVHAFQGFRAPFSGKIVHIFPEQSAAFN